MAQAHAGLELAGGVTRAVFGFGTPLFSLAPWGRGGSAAKRLMGEGLARSAMQMT